MMTSDLIRDDGYRIPDALWQHMLNDVRQAIPPCHPLGCHRQRLNDRAVMDAVLLVLRTGGRWKALPGGMCSGTTAHRRFTEWANAGVFQRFCERGLATHAVFSGIDWNRVNTTRPSAAAFITPLPPAYQTPRTSTSTFQDQP